MSVSDYTDPPTGQTRYVTQNTPALDDTQVRRELVLVVDDDPDLRDIIARHLSKRGFEPVTAPSGRAALPLLRASQPVAVVADVQMPDGDGMFLLREALAIDPDMVFILMTGRPSVDVAIDALRGGAADFLAKPFEFDVLARTLRKSLLKRRSHQTSRSYQHHLESEFRVRTDEWRRALQQQRASNRQLREAYQESLMLLRRASAFRDDETGRHIERISLFSAELAREIGLPPDQVDLVSAASPMHDIGKIGIPDHILRKPGKLTEAEYAVMKTHTTIGGRILAGSETPLLAASAEIALTHHERWDGGGYPTGLGGREIPLSGRIVAVVDAWDALTHERVYKPAYSPQDSLQIMQSCSGSQFDPELIEAFVEIAPRLPEFERSLDDRSVSSRLFGREG